MIEVSINQIQRPLGLSIATLPRFINFDEYQATKLLETHGYSRLQNRLRPIPPKKIVSTDHLDSTLFGGALVVPKHYFDRIDLTEQVLQRTVLAIVALANLLIIISRICLCCDSARVSTIVGYQSCLELNDEIAKSSKRRRTECCGSVDMAMW